MSQVSGVVVGAVDGLRGEVVTVLVAALTLGALVFGIRYSWRTFRMIVDEVRSH